MKLKIMLVTSFLMLGFHASGTAQGIPGLSAEVDDRVPADMVASDNGAQPAETENAVSGEAIPSYNPVPGGQGMTPSGAPGGNVQKSTSITDIKAVEGSDDTYSFELRDARILDLFRILSHDYKLNLLVDNSVGDLKVTASLSKVTLQEALDAISELAGLKMERKGSIIKVSVDIVTEVIALKYISAKKLLETQGSGAATAGMAGGITAGMPGASTGTAATSESNIFGLLSPQGMILLGNQPNSLIVMDLPQNIDKIRKYVSIIDKRMETRTFKLKYLKASDVVGDTTPSTGASSTGSSTSATATTSTTGVMTPTSSTL